MAPNPINLRFVDSDKESFDFKVNCQNITNCIPKLSSINKTQHRDARRGHRMGYHEVVGRADVYQTACLAT
jgi:hypothetical protein